MSVSPTRASGWWHEGIDHKGRVLRADVCKAARDIWETACAEARKESVDIDDATALMEKTVAQLSNWVNHTPPPPGGHNIPGLLMYNFRRALPKHKKRQKMKQVDDPDGMDSFPDPREWDAQLHAKLDYASLSKPLDDREAAIVHMREWGGYAWKTIGEAFGISESRAHHIYLEALAKMKASYEQSKARDRSQAEKSDEEQ